MATCSRCGPAVFTVRFPRTFLANVEDPRRGIQSGSTKRPPGLKRDGIRLAGIPANEDCRTSRPVGGAYGNVVKIRAAVDADALLAAFVDADV